MENKQDYLARVQDAVSQLHDCGATWRETVPVHEIFRGQTVWQGEVEVFDLNGHPKPGRKFTVFTPAKRVRNSSGLKSWNLELLQAGQNHRRFTFLFKQSKTVIWPCQDAAKKLASAACL